MSGIGLDNISMQRLMVLSSKGYKTGKYANLMKHGLQNLKAFTVWLFTENID